MRPNKIETAVSVAAKHLPGDIYGHAHVYGKGDTAGLGSVAPSCQHFATAFVFSVI